MSHGYYEKWLGLEFFCIGTGAECVNKRAQCQLIFNCSKWTIEALEKYGKYAES